MACAQITTYAGLKAGMLAWLARTGDALLDCALRRLPAELRAAHVLRPCRR